MRGKERARALADLEKGLARRSAELAVAGLLALPPEERAAHLGAVVPLFGEAVEAARRGADWSRLGFWAARAEREPRLTGAYADIAWALLWGSARSGEWGRARRWFEALRPALASRAPALERALEVWLSAEGRPAPGALVAPSLPEPDPRLGREAVRARVPPPEPPRQPEEVEAAVLGCCATQAWSAFASRVEEWGTRAAPEVARALWPLAARLALRELFRRLAAGERLACEPAALLGRAAQEAEVREALQAELFLALRAMISILADGTLTLAEDARVLSRLALAVARWPEHRGFVAGAVAVLRVEGAAVPEVLELARQLLRDERSAPLWELALRLVGMRDELVRPPEWLQASLRSLLAGDNPFLGWIRALARKEYEPLLSVIGISFPAPLVGELLDRCWGGADDLLRHALAAMLLDRLEVRAEWAGRAEGKPLSLGSPEEHLLWRGCLERVLPYEDELVDWSLRLASSEPEAWHAVDVYLRGRPGVVSHLEAVLWARSAGWRGVSERVLSQMLRAYSDVPAELARGFEWSRRKAMPPGFTGLLAGELLDAVARQPGPHGPEVERAAAEAKRWAKKPAGGKKARKPSGKKKGGSGKRKGGSKKGKPPQQAVLFEEKS